MFGGDRLLHNIRVPSGDHRGLVNSPVASVICCTPLPSRFITKIWKDSFTRRAKTTRLPSDDQAGHPSKSDDPERFCKSTVSKFLIKIREAAVSFRRSRMNVLWWLSDG